MNRPPDAPPPGAPEPQPGEQQPDDPQPDRDPLAYHDAGFIDERRGPAAPHPGRVPAAARRVPPPAYPRHHRLLRVRAHHRRRTPGRVLRRRPRGRAPGHGVVRRAQEPSPPLPRVHRRRPRDHGGRQPWSPGRRRPLHRPQHRPAARAAPQPVHHPGPLVRVPLLLHAQAVVRLRRAGAHRVPGRVRHPRRAVRVPDSVADRQDRSAAGHTALRHAVLERDRGLRRPGPPGHGGRRRPQAPALRRHAGGGHGRAAHAPAAEGRGRAAPAIARSVTAEDDCATCGPEKEERR